jgi:hypothetical protein
MASFGDSYCGIYCGACSILNHGQTGRGDEFTACLAGVPRDGLACGGCKSDARYAGCRACKIRECAIGRGVAHCAECSEYPCRTYRNWRFVGTILPHLRETSTNVEAIQRSGADAWLASQEKRWSCPGCGSRFSWYAARCSSCGRDLSAEAHALSGIGRLVCRWLLPHAYRKGRSAEQVP